MLAGVSQIMQQARACIVGQCVTDGARLNLGPGNEPRWLGGADVAESYPGAKAVRSDAVVDGGRAVGTALRTNGGEVPQNWWEPGVASLLSVPSISWLRIPVSCSPFCWLPLLFSSSNFNLP